jgi:hypothetical protein
VLPVRSVARGLPTAGDGVAVVTEGPREALRELQRREVRLSPGPSRVECQPARRRPRRECVQTEAATRREPNLLRLRGAYHLAERGLADEIPLWVHPVVWGTGVRIFHGHTIAMLASSRRTARRAAGTGRVAIPRCAEPAPPSAGGYSCSVTGPPARRPTVHFSSMRPYFHTASATAQVSTNRAAMA